MACRFLGLLIEDAYSKLTGLELVYTHNVDAIIINSLHKMVRRGV